MNNSNKLTQEKKESNSIEQKLDFRRIQNNFFFL